ncbi:MAG: tetratricopeptide repeat protein [Rickettsiella sp.]|nr:tetratricopeptide repeat protein [Rickettsiella sp.]
MNCIDTLFKQAITDHQNGNLASAKQSYEQILIIQPLNAQALHGLGMLAVTLQQWDSAINWIQKALTIKPNSAYFHLHLANTFKKNGQFESASIHYQTALCLDPYYAEAHNNFAALLFKQSNYTDARQHYEQAIYLKPNYIEAHFNLALLFVAEQKTEEAITQFNIVLELHPHSIQTHWQLSIIYWQLNELEKVESHYQKLLALNHQSAELFNNLGVLALKKNQPEIAIDYFKQALALEPKHEDARNNLAFTLLEKNAFEASIWHYALYLNLKPDDKEALYNRAQSLMLTGQLDKAIDDLKKIVSLDANHIDAYCNLAAIYLKLDDKAAAIQSYQQVLNREKDHPIASYMLSALTQQSIFSASPIEYVKNLFDSYAPRFDTHLKDTLCYKTPELLRQEITPYLNSKKYKILDLGCGTGLSGIPFSEIAEKLIGIDISSKMLALAKTKNCYSELIEADILNGISQLSEPYDLILCIDTLVYFGKLDALFSVVASYLEEKGLFCFSIEISDTSVTSYRLQTSGRYQHAIIYINNLAKKNNLKCLAQSIVDGRYQKNEFVKTGLFVLKKGSRI